MADSENTRKRSSVDEKNGSANRRTTPNTAKSNLKKTAVRKKRKRRKSNILPEPRTIIIAAAVVILLLVVIGVRSCGISNRKAESVAAELIKASVEGKTSQIKKCYGIKGEISSALQTEIDSLVEYHQAHEAVSSKITASDTLFEEGDYHYVYVMYHLVLEDEQEYPCIRTLMTKKVEKRYYVVPSSEITEELNQKAVDAYTKFMTTDNYKNYTKEYETFLKRNPGYESMIAEKVS